MEYPREIIAALHEVWGKVSYVQKKGKNDFHKYRYAGEADLLEVLRPALLDAGLMLIPSATNLSPTDQHGNTTVTVDYTLVHKSGAVWPEKITAFGAGNDRNKNGVGDKGLYKALTGANKYLLFKLFQIETGDDPEKGEPAPGPGPEAIPEPALIPVNVRDGGSDWESWAKTLIKRVGEATSIPEVNGWMDANGVPLENLKKHSAKAHKHVMDQADKRRGFLAQEAA